MPDIAIVVLMFLSFLLWFVPGHCRCEKCGFHVNEARMKREIDRVRRHRAVHDGWGVAWGSKHCGSCKAGNETDRELD